MWVRTDAPRPIAPKMNGTLVSYYPQRIYARGPSADGHLYIPDPDLIFDPLKGIYVQTGTIDMGR